MQNLLQRTLTALVLGSLTVWLSYKGGIGFRIFAVFLGFLIFVEYLNITKSKYSNFTYKFSIGAYFIFLLLVLAHLPLYGFLTLLACVLFLVFKERGNLWPAGGLIYCAAPVVSIIYIRDFNVVYLIYLYLISWGTDIGGYVFGKLIGGPKLAVKISPNKTYAGAIGGVFLALALVTVYLCVAKYFSYNLFFSAILLSFASQIGDLGESFVKRKFEVKDSGYILPGHGGILDRVDGLMLASVVLAFFLVI